MSFVPTEVLDDERELVVFYEEMVRIGSEQRKLTLYGYFVGANMNINELRYYLRRMWNRHGLY